MASATPTSSKAPGSTVTSEAQLQVRFLTKQEQYAVPDNPYAIQSSVTVADLNSLINVLLKETNANHKHAVDFDFLVCGEMLCTTLSEHLQEKSISTEETLQIEYLERFPAPKPQECLMHDDWVSAVHTCGNWILTGSYDNSVNIWSTKGNHKLAIPGHTSSVKAVSWVSIDNHQGTFVSGSHDQTLLLWVWNISHNTVERIVTCKGHDKGVECLAVSADKMRLVSGGWDNDICIWSIGLSDDDNAPAAKRSKPDQAQSREPLSTMKGHREAVSAVQWMSHNTVLSSGWDHLLKIWDCEAGAISQDIAGNKAFFDANWSPMNNTIVAGCADSLVRIYDPRSASTVQSVFTSHTAWVYSVRWSTTRENLFVSAAYDGQAKLWDNRSPRMPLYDMSGHEDKVLCCDWSNPALLVSGSCDNTVRIFKIKQALGES